MSKFLALPSDIRFVKRAKESATYDESKHSRDAGGKFSTSTSKPSKTKSADAASPGESSTKSWAALAKEVPAKVYQKAKDTAASKYAKLEARYGRKWAIAIMTAGIAGVPLPVPGSSFLTAAPVIAAAEIARRMSKSVSESDSPDLTPEEVEALGKAFLEELLAEWDSVKDKETT